MTSSLQPPRGTRDFYPEDLRRRDWLFGHFRAVARAFGYEEVDAPVLEHAELFTRKAGEEIVEQLYHFELHERRYALRPEFTPSLARMVMARAGSLRLPLRWTAIPQCWRYERMTRGRRREHYQWNMDIWGEPGVAAEAELIAAIFALADRLGLARGDVRIGVSSRALLEETLRAGVLRERPEVFPALCVAIDKLDKIGADAVVELLTAPAGGIALPPPDAREVVDWLRAARARGGGRASCRRTRARAATCERLFELLDAYGRRATASTSTPRSCAAWPTTPGIVFEAFDAERKLRAICGGGRYDRLLETLGGSPLPAVGFGFGDAVIGELLADKGLWPELPARARRLRLRLRRGAARRAAIRARRGAAGRAARRSSSSSATRSSSARSPTPIAPGRGAST